MVVRRRLTALLSVLVAATLSVAACSRANAPAAETPLADDGVDGVWMHQETSGYRETLTLTTHGYEVRGVGTYRKENGDEGRSRITGSLRRAQLVLFIVRDDGVRERWTGRLTRGRLRGEMVVDYPPGHRRFGFDRPAAIPRPK